MDDCDKDHSETITFDEFKEGYEVVHGIFPA